MHKNVLSRTLYKSPNSWKAHAVENRQKKWDTSYFHILILRKTVFQMMYAPCKTNHIYELEMFMQNFLHEGLCLLCC